MDCILGNWQANANRRDRSFRVLSLTTVDYFSKSTPPPAWGGGGVHSTPAYSWGGPLYPRAGVEWTPSSFNTSTDTHTIDST